MSCERLIQLPVTCCTSDPCPGVSLFHKGSFFSSLHKPQTYQQSIKMRCIALFTLTFIASSALGLDLKPGSNIRIDLVPDVETANGKCSGELKSSLTNQVLGWFQEGMSNLEGAAYNQNVTFEMTAYKEVEDRSLLPHPGHRELCSLASCYQCCYQACLRYCGCYLCGGNRRRRFLRDQPVNREAEEAEGRTSEELSTHFKFSVRRWLQANDPDWCLGNPWKITATVNVV